MSLFAVLALAACAAPRSPAAPPPYSCAPGESVLLGACIPRRAVELRCERGRARDVDEGSCVPARDVRAMARAGGVFVADDDAVICESDSDELVARAGRVVCIARASAAAPCPAGTVRDGTACAPLFEGAVLDLARFARAAAAHACAIAAARPAVSGRSEERFVVKVAIRAPDNDPTQASALVSTVPALGDAEADLESAARDAADALRHLPEGAPRTTTATDVTAEVGCSRAWRRPKSARLPEPTLVQ